MLKIQGGTTAKRIASHSVNGVNYEWDVNVVLIGGKVSLNKATWRRVGNKKAVIEVSPYLVLNFQVVLDDISSDLSEDSSQFDWTYNCLYLIDRGGAAVKVPQIDDFVYTLPSVNPSKYSNVSMDDLETIHIFILNAVCECVQELIGR